MDNLTPKRLDEIEEILNDPKLDNASAACKFGFELIAAVRERDATILGLKIHNASVQSRCEGLQQACDEAGNRIAELEDELAVQPAPARGPHPPRAEGETDAD